MTERNYVLHFIGQVISFSGSWIQSVALGYYVYQITGSRVWLGVLSALPLLVSTLLMPIGGVLADKYDKRKTLYLTQAMALIQAVFLGCLVLSHHADMWNICILTVLLGIINAVDGPTRNAFIPELLRKENIGSGVALNGVIIMMARVVGPAIAGFLILWVGVGWTFFINGLSFLPVFLTLSLMRIEHKQKRPERGDFLSGLKFAWNHQQVRLCVLLSGLIGLFGMSYNGILPAIAKDVFNAGPKVLGYMGSAVGLGAMIGGSIVSARSKNLPFNLFVVSGSAVSGLALILFPMTSNIYLALSLLFFAGIGFTLSFSTVRSESQIITNEVRADMKGRVTSLTMMSFFAGMAIGNLIVGYLAKKFGFVIAIGANGVALLLLAGIMFAFRPIKAKKV